MNNLRASVLSRDEETIIAQCTPHGSGAIALLRLCGSDAIAIASKLSALSSVNALEKLPTHTIHHGYVIDNFGDHIDEVMFLLMRAPKTFTGQDTVEITCHNNPHIIANIITLAITHGARHAQEGEFTRRAFLHNKIDLIQAEAINELINANTQMALKKSLAQLEGSFSHWIEQLQAMLLKALALSEASFEFIDEEMAFGTQIEQQLMQVISTISVIKKTFDHQQQIRQGIRIALIGSVNAGKSSLFNALLNQQRAIVTNIPGTTRDVIEASVQNNCNTWTLIDTAGLRLTDDMIEQEGIKRSLQEAQKADVILLVYDCARIMTQAESETYQKIIATHANKVIIVRNKIDMQPIANLVAPSDIPVIELSNGIPGTIKKLENKISEKISHLFASIDSPFLLNQRQYNLLLNLEQHVHNMLPMFKNQIAYEIVSYHLKDGLEQLSELSGKTISEKGMDAVFREFCVGK